MRTQSIAIADEAGAFLHREDAVLPIYSLTKPFIASAVFAAGIDIDEPVSRWVERQTFPRGTDVSVAQLLAHTSGLTDYGGLPEYGSDIQAGLPPWSDDDFADHTLRKPLLFEPGEGWAYSNPGYWLLSQIVQKHTGLSFENVIHDLIAEPLGLSSTRVARGQFADDLPSYPAEWVWHGVLMSSARDIVHFMNSDFVAPLLAKLTKVPFEHPLWTNAHYGYGLMVDPEIRFGHNGEGPNYSASCYHFTESGLTGCVLMQADGEGRAMEVLLKEITLRTR